MHQQNKTAMTPTLAGSLTPKPASWWPMTLAKGVVMMTLILKVKHYEAFAMLKALKAFNYMIIKVSISI